MNAVRDRLLPLIPARGAFDSNPGLLLQRYLHESATGEKGKPEHKQQILDAAIRSASNPDLLGLYKTAFTRWSASLPNDTAPMDLATQGRLIVGLGSENVLETGIRLHHTYGMPIIPGSALKGLAAHYCDQVWGEKGRGDDAPVESKRFRKGWEEKKYEYYKFLFGTTKESGCIIFHDAWYVPDSEKEPLKLDVMTPHHPDYNRDPEKDKKFSPPTDFDSPIPLSFVSVAGTFHIAVSWHGPNHKDSTSRTNWTKRAMDLLCEALCNWGVGGKTSSGYGRFDREKLEIARKEQELQAAKLRLEQEEQAKLDAMRPIDRDIKAFLDSHPDKVTKAHIKLLKELEKSDGRFRTPEDRRAVAERVKAEMQAAKEWKEKEPHGKRKKFIEGILGNQP